MTNLPPGVTDSMIPGNEPYPQTLVLEDFEEIDLDEWKSWDVGEGESACHRCEEVVGFHLGRSRSNPDVDSFEWAACWFVGPWEQVVCESCRVDLIEECVE